MAPPAMARPSQMSCSHHSHSHSTQDTRNSADHYPSCINPPKHLRRTHRVEDALVSAQRHSREDAKSIVSRVKVWIWVRFVVQGYGQGQHRVVCRLEVPANQPRCAALQHPTCRGQHSGGGSHSALVFDLARADGDLAGADGDLAAADGDLAAADGDFFGRAGDAFARAPRVGPRAPLG